MTQRMARACWITAARRAELRTEALPAPSASEVLVQTRWSAISRGSESLIWQHAVPASEHERMRAPFQVGVLPGPVKYGYSNVGRVLAGPAALLGRSVFCLYPHQDEYVVPASAVVPLPEAVPEARAVLAANMETALNALWDARPLLGQRIAVVGAGVVGSLVAYLAARVHGCQVTLVDKLAERAQVAAALGCRFASPDDAVALTGEADLVVHASASEAGLHTALSLARNEATVLELSWFGDARVSLPLGAAFHARRLRLVSSQVGQVADAMRAHRTTHERLALALGFLQDPVLEVLIDGESAFEALPSTLAALATAERPGLCQRIRYPRS